MPNNHIIQQKIYIYKLEKKKRKVKWGVRSGYLNSVCWEILQVSFLSFAGWLALLLNCQLHLHKAERQKEREWKALKIVKSMVRQIRSKWNMWAQCSEKSLGQVNDELLNSTTIVGHHLCKIMSLTVALKIYFLF